MQQQNVLTAANKQFAHQVERGVVLLTIAACALTHAVAGFGPMFYGVIAGAVIALLNWRAIIFLARKTAEGERRSRLFYTLLSGAKMVVLLGTIWATLHLLPIAPIGFVIGMTNLFVAIVVVGLLDKPTQVPTAMGHATEERGA